MYHLNKGIAESRKQKGMKQAVDHAKQVYRAWEVVAFKFFVDYAKSSTGFFMTEDVRRASAMIVPDPPSARAWGLIAQKAYRGGYIRREGYAPSSNPKAHRSIHSVWAKYEDK